MSLTKKQILSADDLPREKVDVPEWAGYVWVRTMTGAERDTFEQTLLEGKKINLKNVRAKLAVLTVVDDAGKRVFDETDMAQLGAKSAAALDRIYAVAQRLNGLTATDAEELAKNSGTDLNGDSTSS